MKNDNKKNDNKKNDNKKNDLESHKTIGKRRFRSGKKKKFTTSIDQKQSKLLDELSDKGYGSKSEIVRQALDKLFTDIIPVKIETKNLKNAYKT